jgi:hypothetical protein
VIERWIQLTCDRCGETDHVGISNITIREARAETGIERIKGYDICLKCKPAVIAGDKANSRWALP